MCLSCMAYHGREEPPVSGTPSFFDVLTISHSTKSINGFSNPQVCQTGHDVYSGSNCMLSICEKMTIGAYSEIFRISNRFGSFYQISWMKLLWEPPVPYSCISSCSDASTSLLRVFSAFWTEGVCARRSLRAN